MAPADGLWDNVPNEATALLPTNLDDRVPRPPANSVSFLHPETSPSLFLTLSLRTATNLYRNPSLLLAHYSITLILGLVIGCLFWQVSDEMAGVQNRLGCLFFVCAFFGFAGLTSGDQFASEAKMFCRERSRSMYPVEMYLLTKLIFDIVPLRVVPATMFASIVYRMVGFYPSWACFAKFTLALVAHSTCCACFALFTSLACFRQGHGVGNLLASLGTLLAMLFGGFLLNRKNIAWPLIHLQGLSWFNYSYEAMLVNELERVVLRDSSTIDVDMPGTLILRQFGFDKDAYWADVLKVTGMSAGMALASLLVLKRFVYEKN